MYKAQLTVPKTCEDIGCKIVEWKNNDEFFISGEEKRWMIFFHVIIPIYSQ